MLKIFTIEYVMSLMWMKQSLFWMKHQKENNWSLVFKSMDQLGNRVVVTKYIYCMYLEYHSVCPVVRIGTPLSPASECIPPHPPPEPKGVGTHPHAGEGGGVPIRTTCLLCCDGDGVYSRVFPPPLIFASYYQRSIHERGSVIEILTRLLRPRALVKVKEVLRREIRGLKV